MPRKTIKRAVGKAGQRALGINRSKIKKIQKGYKKLRRKRTRLLDGRLTDRPMTRKEARETTRALVRAGTHKRRVAVSVGVGVGAYAGTLGAGAAYLRKKKQRQNKKRRK